MSTIFNALPQLGVVLLLVMVNGFFVAAEFALVGSRRTQLEQLAAGGNGAAGLARDMVSDLDRYIAAAQLGITLASLALGWVGEAAIAMLVEPPIEYGLDALLGSLSVSEDIALAVSHGIGVAVSFFVITSLHIVLGEQAPKVLAIRAPEQVALWIARPLAVFNTVFSILIRFLDWATTAVLYVFGVREPAGGHTKVHSADELRMLVEESGEAGALDEGEQEMLINVFTFADRPAYQAMIPRTEMSTIDYDATLRDFVDLFAKNGHTRYPVVGPGGVDDVQGMVSAKDLLLHMRGPVDDSSPITPLVRQAFFTPESKRVGDLLQEMRGSNMRLAVLIDEYGGVAGIVTLEDLIEQIIGDLSDEYAPDTAELTTIDEHTSVVEGQVRIEDVNDELDLALPSGEYETLAGFILERLGRLPQPGDAVQYQNARLTVLEMQGPRIRRVEVTKS